MQEEVTHSLLVEHISLHATTLEMNTFNNRL
jgi:hypothetical protein